MTNQEKQLLLVDLCARLSFGITIYRITDNSIHRIQYSDITENIDQFSHFLEYSGIENIKPYLRPMSSMTEEEENEYKMFIDYSYNDFTSESHPCVFTDNIENYINWLNKNMFDYRGLIPMGLALEAPEGMYNIK